MTCPELHAENITGCHAKNGSQGIRTNADGSVTRLLQATRWDTVTAWTKVVEVDTEMKRRGTNSRKPEETKITMAWWLLQCGRQATGGCLAEVQQRSWGRDWDMRRVKWLAWEVGKIGGETLDEVQCLVLMNGNALLQERGRAGKERLEGKRWCVLTILSKKCLWQ